MQEYQATFGIDCGISPGFAVKSPHYEKQERVLTADNPIDAIIAAAKQARLFSVDYLSNPNNDLTTVCLLELSDPNKNSINVKKVLKEAGYDCIQRFKWNNEGKLIIECSMLEHALLITSQSTA